MSVDEETIKKIANQLASEIASELRRSVDTPNICKQCTCERDKEMHEKHHQLIAKVIQFLDKIEGVKWRSISFVVSAIMLAMVSWFIMTVFGIKITR